MKKQRILKQNGVAPLGFDDVTKGLQPWYTVQRARASTDNTKLSSNGVDTEGRVFVRGRELAGEDALLARRRDEVRKYLFDPMAEILKNEQGQTASEALRVKKGVCESFKKRGTCRRGDQCPYFHGKNVGLMERGMGASIAGSLSLQCPSAIPSSVHTPAISDSNVVAEPAESTSMAERLDSDTDQSIGSSVTAYSSLSSHIDRKKHKRQWNEEKGKKSKKEKRKKKDRKEKGRSKERRKSKGKLKECPICFEEKSLSCRLGDCSHTICEDCGLRWNSGCPICRDVKKEDTERLALRRQRLDREQAERRRSSTVMVECQEKWQERMSGTRFSGFNSQFNPHLARQSSSMQGFRYHG